MSKRLFLYETRALFFSVIHITLKIISFCSLYNTICPGLYSYLTTWTFNKNSKPPFDGWLITTKRAQHRFAIPQKEVVKLNRKLKGRLWMVKTRQRANKAGKLAGNSSSCCSPGLFASHFQSYTRRYMRIILSVTLCLDVLRDFLRQ